MSDNISPRSNCIWEETSHVSRRLASYFMKCIINILTVQRSAVSREFVFKKKASSYFMYYNLMYL